MLAAVEDAVSYRWGHVEELLAEIFETLDASLIAFLLANTPKNRQHEIREPRRYPRPVRPEAKPRRRWFDILASMPGGRRR